MRNARGTATQATGNQATGSQATGYRVTADRLIFAVAIIALVIGLTLSELARRNDRQAAERRAAEFSQDLAQTKREAQAALSSVIQPDVIANANRSVYLVTVNGSPAGTAFVVNRDRGVLATAAHVVEALPIGEENFVVEVINQHSGERLPVVAARMHIGYGSFSKAVEDYQPVRTNTPLINPHIVAVEETPFDAGVLVIDPIDAQTGENNLGPNLPIADEASLLAMKPGDPIAVIGFPRDRIGRAQVGDAADSRVERGVVSAMIAPVDNVGAERNPAVANLIVHRMATAGGNSGSPVMNAKGEVVGIHTHGVSGSDSNGDGLAQRADMLIDLLAPLREEHRLATLFQPAWEARLNHWRRAEEVLPWSLYERSQMRKRLTNGKVLKVSDIDFEAEAPFRQYQRDAFFTKPTRRYAAAALDLAQPPAKPAADQPQNKPRTVDAVTQPAFVLEGSGQYFEAILGINPNRDNLIYAFDYAANNSRGYCSIEAYWRPLGSDQLKRIPANPTPRIYLPAVSNKASRVHIVFKRSALCDRRSRAFLYGKIDWPATTPEPRQTAALPQSARPAPSENAANAAHASPLRKAMAASLNEFNRSSVKFRHFVDCKLVEPMAPGRCSAPRFIPVSQVHAEDLKSLPALPENPVH